MWLQSLSLLNFKNHEEAQFDFSRKVNCLVGNNGVGKTNVLDAVHYLSLCKSFFNSVDQQQIYHGQNSFMIRGLYNIDNESVNIGCAFELNKKKTVKRNKKPYKKLADHIGLIPLVMLSPIDILLIIDGSEVRRKLIDGIISQFNKTYLANLVAYNKVLLQRNALLKQMAESHHFDASLLSAWDEQLMHKGNYIFEARLDFVEQFTPLFDAFYKKISGTAESVVLAYQSQLNEKGFETLLSEALPKDKIVQHTTVGIHKDDLLFEIEGNLVKKFASQGQQKTFLLALRLAQAKFIEKQMGKKPILLLDDIYDKLDNSRVSHLMDLLHEEDFGQLFITDTHCNRLPDLFAKINIETKTFQITLNEKKPVYE